ncbi:ankyrin repeat domain-containing protein [Cognataquiflexum rubidum]|uniref:ankyrin repeat domain-containing protein n=1 Tax=Cognataquiflexum rubidum TaxID=2922273 RepID=UPI001F12E941|nr:ankyrin repeat domain-containing protein [Cognataquiflexum rubidum]MCH6234196.1 ankyrin repeat domain-containing protein [Cognataquiflexum rubidum]
MNKKSERLNEDEMFDLFDQTDFSKVEVFVEKYGINSVDRDGRNLLINFIIEHKSNFAIKLINEFKELNINKQDKNDWSALHFAVQENDLKVVTTLLKKESQVDIVDENGNTPLADAIFNEVDENIIISLLENGASLNKKNHHGISPKDFINKDMSKVVEWIKKNSELK